MNHGSMAMIWKQRPSHPNGNRLVFQTWIRSYKAAARPRPCYLCFLIGKVLSTISTPLQARQLTRNITSVFFIGWEMQYNENSTPLGNWCLAASSCQYAYSCIMSHTEFWGKTSNPPGDSAPLQPRFGTLQLLAFPKINHLWKGRDFRPLIRFRKIWQQMASPTKDFAEF